MGASIQSEYPTVPQLEQLDTFTVPSLYFDSERNTFVLEPVRNSIREYVDAWDREWEDSSQYLLDGEPITDFASYLSRLHPQAAKHYSMDVGQNRNLVDHLDLWVEEQLDPDLHIIIESGDGQPWAALRGEVIDFLCSAGCGEFQSSNTLVLDTNKLAHEVYGQLVGCVPPVKGAGTGFDLDDDDWEHVSHLQFVEVAPVNGEGLVLQYWTTEHDGLVPSNEIRYTYSGWDVVRTLNTLWGTSLSDPEAVRTNLGMLTEPEGGALFVAETEQPQGLSVMCLADA